MAKDKAHAPGEKGHFWIVVQHGAVTLVDSAEPPELAVQPGERTKRRHGPYADRAVAQRYADRITARANRAPRPKEA